MRLAGFTIIGDGGSGKWKQNGVTGQTPNQTPEQLGDGKILNDNNGNQWELVGGALLSNATYNIPSDFSVLQEAIDTTYASIFPKQGVVIDLLIESGHTEESGLLLTGGDYSQYTISSIDAIVPVIIQNNGTTGFIGKGSHFFFENCEAPIVNCLFDAETTGGRYAAGITVRYSTFKASTGCGLINVGVPQLTTSPPDTLEPQFGYNCLIWNSSKALINGAIFSGAAQRCLWVSPQL